VTEKGIQFIVFYPSSGEGDEETETWDIHTTHRVIALETTDSAQSASYMMMVVYAV
jgi:ribosomal protein S10